MYPYNLTKTLLNTNLDEYLDLYLEKGFICDLPTNLSILPSSEQVKNVMKHNYMNYFYKNKDFKKIEFLLLLRARILRSDKSIKYL